MSRQDLDRWFRTHDHNAALYVHFEQRLAHAISAVRSSRKAKHVKALVKLLQDDKYAQLEFVPLMDQTVPGFPGMTWSATATEDENRPLLWLVKIEAKWLDEGEEVVAEFLRVVPRQLPMRDRVMSFREGSTEPPR